MNPPLVFTVTYPDQYNRLKRKVLMRSKVLTVRGIDTSKLPLSVC